MLGEVDGTDNQVKAAYTWGADGLVSEHLISTGYGSDILSGLKK